MVAARVLPHSALSPGFQSHRRRLFISRVRFIQELCLCKMVYAVCHNQTIGEIYPSGRLQPGFRSFRAS